LRGTPARWTMAVPMTEVLTPKKAGAGAGGTITPGGDNSGGGIDTFVRAIETSDLDRRLQCVEGDWSDQQALQ
jgi:hypothetical protein